MSGKPVVGASMDGEGFLTYQEASDLFGVPVGTLSTWRLRKEIRRYRRGDGRVVVSRDEVAQRIARKLKVVAVDE